MLKVSRARVYLSKLASAAKLVKMARAMKKVAAGTPNVNKPVGTGSVGTSGVDVTKGFDASSNSVNGQSVVSPVGSGGVVNDTTSTGVSNMANGPLGKGSPYNVAAPTSATGYYRDKSSNKIRTSALPAPGTSASEKSVVPKIKYDKEPTKTPQYMQWRESNVNNAMQNQMREWSQDPLEVPDLSSAPREVIDQWEQRIREARAAGRPVSSANQPWGHFDSSRLDPDRVAFWNANSSVPAQTAMGQYYDANGRPIADKYQALGTPVRADEYARQHGIQLTPAVAEFNPLVRSFTPGSATSKALGIKDNWGGFSEPGNSIVNLDPSQPNARFSMDHEMRHDMVYNMRRMMRQPSMGIGSAPMSFQEAEFPTTLGELSSFQQSPEDDLHMAYADRLYARPSQFGYADANSNYGTVNATDTEYASIAQGSQGYKQRFFPVTPLRNMVVPSSDGNGYRTVAGNEMGFVGPSAVQVDNHLELNPYLSNMVHNVGQLPTAYREAHADRGNYFATQEFVQNAYNDIYAQSQPVGAKIDYTDIQRASDTVQQIMRKATSGNVQDFIEASRVASFLRPDLQAAIVNAQGDTMEEKAKWLHDNAQSMENVQAILNANPDNITPEMVEGQAKYSVSPGWDKVTDIRNMATMGHAIDDLYAGTYYRDVVPQYLNQGELTDTLPSYSFSDPNDGPSITYVPQSETDKAQAARNNRSFDTVFNGGAPEDAAQNTLEEERIAEENAYGNHQMRARWVDPKTIPPHEREIPSFMRGISSSETPVTNAPSVDPPVASSAAAPDVTGVDSVNYDDSISFGHPTGAENYYRPDEAISSTSEVHDWTDYDDADLSNLGSGFVDNSGSEVLDSNPYDPQAEPQYDPDQIYRDFGIDPNNRQPDGSLLPPVRLGQQEDDPDQIYRDFGIDPSNRQPDGSLLPPLVLGQDSEGADPYAPADPYSNTGLDSMEDSLSNLGSGFMDNSGSEALDSIPYASPDEMEYDTYGYAASQEEEPSFDKMMEDEEARINSGAYDDLYGDYTPPEETTPEEPKKRKTWLSTQKEKIRRLKEKAEQIKNDPNAEHNYGPNGEESHSGYIEGWRSVSNSESAGRRVGGDQSREAQPANSGNSVKKDTDLHDRNLPPSAEAMTPAGGNYTDMNGKKWSDWAIKGIGTPEQQYEALSGDALERSMMMNMLGGLITSNLFMGSVDNAIQEYRKALTQAQAEGKLSQQNARNLDIAFRDMLWDFDDNAMQSYADRNGLTPSKAHQELHASRSGATPQEIWDRQTNWIRDAGFGDVADSLGKEPPVMRPSSSSGSGPSSPKPARDNRHQNTHVSNTSRRDRVSPSTSKPRDVGQVSNSGGGVSRSGSASDRTYQSGSVSYTQEDLDDFIATKSPEEQYRELEGDALVYAMSQRLPSECQRPLWKNRPPKDALSMYAQGPLAKAVMDGKITTEQAADLFNAFYEQMWHVKPDSMYSYEQENGIETTPERMEILSNAKRAREQYSDERAAARNAEFYNDSVLSYNPLGNEPLPGMPGAGNNDPRYISNIPPRRFPPRSAY